MRNNIELTGREKWTAKRTAAKEVLRQSTACTFLTITYDNKCVYSKTYCSLAGGSMITVDGEGLHWPGFSDMSSALCT